jgi:NADPH-dependent 2,4-dienoyl-CoA reductase/sulfur reductase-like enzyme
VDSPVTVICAEPHAPYDRPPMSKQVLRGERRETPLRDDWTGLDVDLLVTLLRVGPNADRLLAVYGRDGVLTAVLGANAPRWAMRMRPMLRDGAPYTARA